MERKEEICRLICEEVEKAGSGGFTALAQLHVNPIYDHKKGRPIGLRKNARMYHLVEAIGVPEPELREFCDGVSPEMLERVRVAGEVWLAKMNTFWKAESGRIEAKLASNKK